MGSQRVGHDWATDLIWSDLIWCEQPTHWIRPWCWERLRTEEKKAPEDELVGQHHWCNGHECGKLQERVKDREACCAAVHGVMKSQDTAWRLDNKTLWARHYSKRSIQLYSLLATTLWSRYDYSPMFRKSVMGWDLPTITQLQSGRTSKNDLSDLTCTQQHGRYHGGSYRRFS